MPPGSVGELRAHIESEMRQVAKPIFLLL